MNTFQLNSNANMINITLAFKKNKQNTYFDT